jgi:3-deoxy-D-manno-octulosonic acid (KDO) 8-phosphate synthase
MNEEEPSSGHGPYVLVVVLAIALVAFAVDSVFLVTHVHPAQPPKPIASALDGSAR